MRARSYEYTTGDIKYTTDVPPHYNVVNNLLIAYIIDNHNNSGKYPKVAVDTISEIKETWASEERNNSGDLSR